MATGAMGVTGIRISASARRKIGAKRYRGRRRSDVQVRLQAPLLYAASDHGFPHDPDENITSSSRFSRADDSQG